jgi:sec-independent protein translocase protein TatA
LFNIGPAEIMVILIIALIVFGPKRLPEIGRTVGKGLREFRRASQDIRDQFESNLDDEEDASAKESPEANEAPVLTAESEGGSAKEGSAPTTLDGSAPSA